MSTNGSHSKTKTKRKTKTTAVEEEAKHTEADLDQKASIAWANDLMRQAYTELSTAFEKPMPVGKVQWIHIDQVQANDYNPNAVAHQEMRLLFTSIDSDGYTQPVVTIYDEALDKYVIVDGYHRYTTMRKYTSIYNDTLGYLPVVVIDKPIADRIASTVRHNRARGKHSVQGMGSLVFQMLNEGESDTEICNKLGLEAQELARLKHITGYSKLYAEQEYSQVIMTKAQADEKAKYARENPGEKVREF